MTRITEIWNLILSVLMWRVSYDKISAVLLLLALLMPITGPIPAWAYDLKIDPAPIDNRLSLLPPQPSLATALANFGGNLYYDAAAFLTKSWGTEKKANVSLEELGKRVKQIETPIEKIERLTLGQTIQLSAIPLDENGNAVHGIVPEWVSKDNAILKIKEGKAVAKGIGEIVLTVKAGNVSKNLTIKVEDDQAAVKQAEPEVKVKSKGSTPARPLFFVDTEQNVRDSTYTPENNLGATAGKSEIDSPNPTASLRIRHRAGIANFNFAVPFASLPGRGINASIGMNYNSRVWNRTGEGSSASYQYNVDQNWLAPGFTVGFGKLTSRFASRTVLTTGNQYKAYNEVVPEGFTDAAGSRHQLECKTWAAIPNTQSMGGTNLYCTQYATNDGSFIKVTYYGDRPLSGTTYPPSPDMSVYASTFFTLSFPNGTKIKYSAPGAQFAATDFAREHYPVQMQDNNGNQIDVAYKDGKDNIEYIRDTLGRYIRFYYDPTAEKKLVAVTVPGFDGGADRQTIRLYYDENVSLAYQGRFSGSASGPSTYRALRYVYSPATGEGYRYDYHPNFGMITKITKLTGMTVTGNSLTSTGTVNTGAAEASTTEYLYPNDGSQTPLTDVPKYTQRTDDWQGRTPAGSPAPVTYYDAPEPAPNTDQVSEVTIPGAEFDMEYKTIQYNTTDWHNGLTKETSINKYFGPGQPHPYIATMARGVYTWDQGTPDSSGRRSPILVRIDTTNDAGQIQAHTFAYDAYNNQTVAREHDFAAQGVLGTELRRTEITYETGTGTGWMNNGLVHLPKEIKTIVNNVTVSRVVYEYDNYGAGFAPTPGVIQHNAGYDPSSGTHDCNPHYVCDPGDYPPHCPLEYDQCPNYDPAAYFRGNVTKVISFPDTAAAENNPDNSVQTMKYDITGNVVEASMSCCNVKTIEYAAANQYAYMTKETKGSGPQLVKEASYDFNTGLVKNTHDENSQQTSFTYDPATLRQTRVDFPNGAWSTVEYNDTQFPYSVKSTNSLDSTRSVSSWSFFDGAGHGFRSRSQTANGYISSDVEFDNLDRAVKSYNPYTVASLSAERPSTGIPFTEMTKFDALGRTLETKLPDATIVTAEYSGVTATVTDQTLKKRRRTADALGRIVRVDEPNAGGQLDVGGVPYQPTYYEYDGNDNLAKVTQTAGGTTQERVFQYDALSRLRRERQVEASPTLDASGVYGSPAPTKWTGVYNYNADGLLSEGVDARGVKTTFAYDGLNRVQSVTYTGETGYQTPQVTYTYSETESGFYNTGRLTKMQTAANTTYGIPATVQNYDYDSIGQVKKHVQSIGSEVYSMEYGYNLAGQLVSEKYPSGKVINTTVDNFGVTQTVADSQKTYLNGMTINDKGQLSQLTLGNGTTEVFSFNDRSQMTSQSLKKGAEVLQKYDYTYGQVNIATGDVTAQSNNGQLGKIESFIGSNKQASQRFAYDELGRLSESREYRGDNNSLTYKQKFDFDRFGNLYRKAASNPTSGQTNPLPYTPIEDTDINKSTNRFATGTTYDNAGQVTNDTKFRSMGFGYDANGRQVKATRASAPDAATVYDALGNRVATKINNVWQYVIYDAFGKLVAEYGIQSDGAGGVKYVQQDLQGSVRAVTNNNGFVVSRTDHQAFGDEIGVGVGLRSIEKGYTIDKGTAQSYGLTENDDATGQQHTGYRKLETQAGRWSSPDPYKGSMALDDPQSFNGYSYVGNEPTNYVDPSGLAMMICEIRHGELQCYSSQWGVTDAGQGWDNGLGRNRRFTIFETDMGETEPDFNNYDFWFPFFGGYNGSGSNCCCPPNYVCDEFGDMYRIGEDAGPCGHGTTASSAVAKGNSVVYTFPGGGTETRQGGSRAWRNNNPGNIRPGNLSGEIGRAGGFTVFQDTLSGQWGIVQLLNRPAYQGLTVAGAVARYAPPGENNTAGYQAGLISRTGLSAQTPMSSLSQNQIHAVAGAIKQIEGWKVGKTIC